MLRNLFKIVVLAAIVFFLAACFYIEFFSTGRWNG